MSINLAVIMDPIEQVNIRKDTTFALLLEAKKRACSITYLQQKDLHQHNGRTHVTSTLLNVFDQADHWFELGGQSSQPLDTFDVVLMRKDPPFNMEYIYTTYLLQQAADAGVLVVNHPQALRDANEKLVVGLFPALCTPNLVTRSADDLHAFINEYQDVILKPLDGMGGASIFKVSPTDPNLSVIIETLTDYGQTTCMAQRFIPEISRGDKRILVIDGEPVPYALARIPAQGETRGNLAAGGHGEGIPLTERDRHIVATVAPYLRRSGILFAGLDVIGDYLTEINITSPTCVRELDAQYGLNIAGVLFDCLEQKLAA